MHEQTEFTYKDYWYQTILPSLVTTSVAFIPMLGLRLVVGNNVYGALGYAIIAAIWTCLSVFLVGMNKRERTSIIEFAKNKLYKINK